jgi:hypothetical protein
MSVRQRWRRVSLADKLMVINSAFLTIGTFLLAVGTFCLVFAAVYQYRAMKEQAEITRSQLNTMNDQSNAQQQQSRVMERQANSMKEQTDSIKQSLALTNRIVDATEKQAETSQMAAKATEDSVLMSKFAFNISERADPFVKSFRLRDLLVGDKNPVLQLVLSNAGHLTFTGALTDSTYAIGRRSSMNFPLRNEKAQDMVPFTVAPSFEERTITISFAPLPQRAIKDLDDQNIFLFFYGQLQGHDSLGRTHRVPFCYKYDKAAPGLVSVCPSWVLVAK